MAEECDNVAKIIINKKPHIFLEKINLQLYNINPIASPCLKPLTSNIKKTPLKYIRKAKNTFDELLTINLYFKKNDNKNRKKTKTLNDFEKLAINPVKP